MSQKKSFIRVAAFSALLAMGDIFASSGSAPVSAETYNFKMTSYNINKLKIPNLNNKSRN